MEQWSISWSSKGVQVRWRNGRVCNCVGVKQRERVCVNVRDRGCVWVVRGVGERQKDCAVTAFFLGGRTSTHAFS